VRLELLSHRPRAPWRADGTPVLVLGGAADALLFPHLVEATARAWHTRARIFPDVAHAMMLHPGRAPVARHVAAWLDTHLP